MNFVDVLSAVLSLVSGIGIFVIACSMMSSNLESLSSNKLKSLFSKISDNYLLGVSMGALGTAAIQSSGATMVMVIGFVNAGIMNLTQATTIMYGSDIGTTLTGQIVAMGLVNVSSISSTLIFSSLAGIGVIISSIAKTDKGKKIGGILSGFGMLFIGLDMMSLSMGKFAELEAIKLFLAKISNPILLAIIGAIITAIIQSSSVMTSLSITMVFAGLININQGIYLTMGANVGSCVVGMIAGFTSGTNAKRTSFIQLVYNAGGVALFMIIGELISMLSGGNVSYGSILQSLFPDSPEEQLAMFHTMFNVLSAIICLPLTKALVKLSMIAIEDKNETINTKTSHLAFLDTYMLKTPSIAVEQVKKEIINMSNIANENFNRAIHAITNNDVTDKDIFDETESNINAINHELTGFVSELSRVVVNEKDSKYLSKTYHSIIDFERIGDYAENIYEYAQELIDSNEKFSTDAKNEIAVVVSKINDLQKCVMNAYETNDASKVAEANALEDEIDDLTDRMDINHINRLTNGKCTANLGAKFISLGSDIERIADHLINVSKTIG